MYVDIDMLFDDLEGYAFQEKTTVSAVIKDSVKCEDDSVLRFYEDIDYSISEYDDLVLLRRRTCIGELRTQKTYFDSNQDERSRDILNEIERRIEIAESTGHYDDYKILCNDSVFDVFEYVP